MRRKPRKYDDDDGRSIADMNVEGMPWYDPRRENKAGSKDVTGQPVDLDSSARGPALLGILAAVAVVTVIFGVIFLLVILGILLIGRHGLHAG